MLLAGWEVRTVKKLWPRYWLCCPKPRAAFSTTTWISSPRSPFFTLRGPTLSRTLTCLSIFSWNKVAYKWVCLQTVYKIYNERTSEYLLHKERCIKEQIFSNYFRLVAFSSPVKFSKVFFSGVKFQKFRATFEVVLQKQFLPVVASHWKSDFSAVNWVADSEEVRQVYNFHRNSLEYRNDQRIKVDCYWQFFSESDTRRASNSQTNFITSQPQQWLSLPFKGE